MARLEVGATYESSTDAGFAVFTVLSECLAKEPESGKLVPGYRFLVIHTEGWRFFSTASVHEFVTRAIFFTNLKRLS